MFDPPHPDRFAIRPLPPGRGEPLAPRCPTATSPRWGEVGALAWTGDRIVKVGKTADVAASVTARQVIDGRRFVVTPGLVNSHIHVTGEPLTRGFVPDDISFEENVWKWISPLHFFYEEADE